jgi:hypothetical protein
VWKRAAATLPKDGDGHGAEARTEQRGNFWLATGASYPVKRRCDADRHAVFVWPTGAFLVLGGPERHGVLIGHAPDGKKKKKKKPRAERNDRIVRFLKRT